MLTPPKLEVGQLVEVIWRDAHSDDAWKQQDDVVIEPQICKTVGFFLRYANKAIVIAASVDVGGPGEGTEVGSTWVIPIGMIERVEKLDDPRRDLPAQPRAKRIRRKPKQS